MTAAVKLNKRAMRARLWPYLALLLSMVSVQYGATFAESLFPAVGAEGAAALRLGFGALMLAAVLRPWRARLSWRAAPALLGYGVSLGLMNLTFYLAIRTIPLGLAVALEFIGPLTMAACASRRPLDFLWIGLALAGVLFLLPLRGALHAVDPSGAAYALAAGAGWAAYSLFGQKTGAVHGAATPAIGTIIAAAIVVPVGVLHAGTALALPAVLASGLVVGLFCSAIPYTLEMVALVGMSTQVYGTMTSVEPAIAALAGAMCLHQSLSPVQMAAMGAIILASLGMAVSGRAQPVVPVAN